MSDVDSLVAAFQSQLSEVMETLVKTAMYEVTRLVEDGLLEQLKSRSHEVECLKVQLQLTQRTPPSEDCDGAASRRKSDLNASPPYGAEDGDPGKDNPYARVLLFTCLIPPPIAVQEVFIHMLSVSLCVFCCRSRSPSLF